MRRLLVIGLLCCTVGLFGQEETAETGKAEESEPQPPIEYKWLNFAILTAGLGYLIVSKGFPALNERGRDIEQALKAAERIKAEAAAEEAAIDRKMAGLKAEIEEFRTSAQQEMAAERERMTGETRSLIAKLQANAESEIATKHAQNALRTQASELALSLARQKVAARINAATDAGLIAGFVSDLKNIKEARN